MATVLTLVQNIFLVAMSLGLSLLL